MELIKQTHKSLKDGHSIYMLNDTDGMYYSGNTNRLSYYRSNTLRNFVYRMVTTGKWVKV